MKHLKTNWPGNSFAAGKNTVGAAREEKASEVLPVLNSACCNIDL